MVAMRRKQFLPGSSLMRVFGGLSLALLAASGCVKKVSSVPKPNFNSAMARIESDPDLRLRELQRESADYAALVHALPGKTPSEDRDRIRQAFGTLAQLLPLVQVGPHGGVFDHQVSVVSDTQTLLSDVTTDLSTAPIIDRGLRAVYNALDDAQHGGTVYSRDAALRAILDKLSAKNDEFDTARGALHDLAWADAFNLTSDAISRMAAILAERLGEGTATAPATPATSATEPAPSTVPPAATPGTVQSEPGTMPTASAPATGPAEPGMTPPPAVPMEPATAPAVSAPASAPSP